MVDIETIIDIAEMEGCPKCGSQEYICDGDEMICEDCGYTCSIDELVEC